MLDASEALLLSGGNQLTVAQERRGGVVVIAGNSEDIHLALVSSPFQINGFPGMVKPIGGPLLDVQGI